MGEDYSCKVCGKHGCFCVCSVDIIEPIDNIYRNKNTNLEYLGIKINDIYRLYSCEDETGNSDITVSKEQFENDYEFIKKVKI